MKRQPHTACHTGKRVIVKLVTGITFVDKFKERTNKEVLFENAGWIRKSQIQSFSIYKHIPSRV